MSVNDASSPQSVVELTTTSARPRSAPRRPPVQPEHPRHPSIPERFPETGIPRTAARRSGGRSAPDSPHPFAWEASRTCTWTGSPPLGPARPKITAQHVEFPQRVADRITHTLTIRADTGNPRNADPYGPVEMAPDRISATRAHPQLGWTRHPEGGNHGPANITKTKVDQHCSGGLHHRSTSYCQRLRNGRQQRSSSYDGSGSSHNGHDYRYDH